MKVRITKCSNEDWWYANKIGEVFSVSKDPNVGDYYINTIDTKGKYEHLVIDKYDCEIVSEKVDLDIPLLTIEYIQNKHNKVYDLARECYLYSTLNSVITIEAFEKQGMFNKWIEAKRNGWKIVTSPEIENLHYQIRATPDMVNNPPHYRSGEVECIDAIQSALTEEEFRGYCKGTSIAYIWRERLKNGDEDINKCKWYLNRLTETK